MLLRRIVKIEELHQNVKRLMISILDTNFPLQKVKIRKLFEKYAFPGIAFEAV